MDDVAVSCANPLRLRLPRAIAVGLKTAFSQAAAVKEGAGELCPTVNCEVSPNDNPASWPDAAAACNAKAAKTGAALDALDAEIAALLAPVKGKPLITFHDAFQYFEKRYGVEASGSITVNPDEAPGAERVAELQAKVKELGVTCVFAEPNFEPKIINVVIEGSNAKVGTLDPDASGLAEGPDLYFSRCGE